MKKTLLFVSAMAAVNAHALILDDFMTGPYSVSIKTGSDTAVQAGSMIGGFRRTFVQVQANPLNQNLDFTVGNGFAITSSGTLLDALTEIKYGSVANLNADISSFDSLKVRFVSNDLAQVMKVTLQSSSGGGQTETVSLNVGTGVGFDVVVPYSSFTTFSEFDDVDMMTFTFDTVANGDFAISSIEAVPEPASLIALSLGAAALLRRRRQ